MKLLIVINQFYKGGAETNLLNLLKALPETDDQVDLLVYDQMKLPNVISLLPQVPPHVTGLRRGRARGRERILA
ncbi:MAG: hypothetical protein ACLUN5_18945 [Oscillospiraceae bacterium]